MVKVLIPSYMIGERDKVDILEAGYAIFNMESEKRIDDVLKDVYNLAPDALSSIIKDNVVNKNVVIAYNGKLLKHNVLTQKHVHDNDEIEILTQFAGG